MHPCDAKFGRDTRFDIINVEENYGVSIWIPYTKLLTENTFPKANYDPKV